MQPLLTIAFNVCSVGYQPLAFLMPKRPHPPFTFLSIHYRVDYPARRLPLYNGNQNLELVFCKCLYHFLYSGATQYHNGF